MCSYGTFWNRTYLEKKDSSVTVTLNNKTNCSWNAKGSRTSKQEELKCFPELGIIYKKLTKCQNVKMSMSFPEIDLKCLLNTVCRDKCQG